MLKPFPILTTDEEAEDFVANADLTEYDWSSLRPVRFDFTPGKGVTMHDAVTGEQLRPKVTDGTVVTAVAASTAPSGEDDAHHRPLATAPR